MADDDFPAGIEVEALRRLRSSGQAVTVLDVREGWEREICRLDGSLDIPLAILPAHVDKLPRQGMLVVMCHHGARSGQAAAWLRAQGFSNAVNLNGGIDAWAARIDRGMGTY